MSSIRFLLLSAVLSVGLVACSGAEPTVRIVPTALPTATPVITPVVVTVEPTATATLSPTPTSTSEPTATATSIPRPTATPTLEPTATATPEPSLGDRGNPVPFGHTVEVATGDPLQHWEIAILETHPDSWDVIQAKNQFNDPPEDGMQFYMLRLRAKYLGPDSTTFDGDFKSLGDSGLVYETYPSCGVIPDEIDTYAELFTGGQIEGNECWPIATGDAESLVMFIDFGYGGNRTRVWFSLR